MKYAELIDLIMRDGKFLGDPVGKCLRTSEWTGNKSPGIDRLFKKSRTWAAFQTGEDLSLRFDTKRSQGAFLIWQKGKDDPEPDLPAQSTVEPTPGTPRVGYMPSLPMPVDVDVSSGIIRDQSEPTKYALVEDVESCLYSQIQAGEFRQFEPVENVTKLVPQKIPVSAIRFRKRFDQFKLGIKESSGEPFSSFSEGLPFREEGYKDRLHDEGRQRLNFQNWKEDWIGKGQILSHVIQAIEIDDTSGDLRNNFVQWNVRFGPDGQSHQPLLLAKQDPTLLKKTERAMFNLFHELVDDEEAFDDLCNLGLRSYDVIAYLFYLRDWEVFAPVSPTRFDKAFEMLDVPLKTSRQSSWENYTQFNVVLGTIQQLLVQIGGVESVRLIDAHTFCWMLSGLNIPDECTSSKIEKPIQMSLVEPCSDSNKSPVTSRFEEKVDYESRDHSRRRVGRLAEEIALQSEKSRLVDEGYPQFAETEVRIVSENSTLGYDILSCEVDGSPRQIEVKAVRKRNSEINFYLTENERRKSEETGNYWFYFVTAVDSDSPLVYAIRADDSKKMKLEPIVYRVSARML